MANIVSSSDSNDNSDLYTFDEEHTLHNPYCSDVSHWCHNSPDYHEMVIALGASDEEIAEAYAFLGLPL